MASSSSTSSSSSTTSSLYDGTNLEIREPHCADCLRTESEAEEEEEACGAPLQRCSRCGVMWYCNRDCQQSDFPSHKFWCRNVHAARTKLQALAETLRNCKLPDGTVTNLFETRVGDFMVRFPATANDKERDADVCVVLRPLTSLAPGVQHTYHYYQLGRRTRKRRGSTGTSGWN
jgi:MYND finger